jgi:6-phosphofructokinase 1
MAGEKAVQFAISEDRSGSVTIHRTPASPYSVTYQLSPLEELAAKTRTMPDAFIAEAGNGVTDAFRDYLKPLLGSGLPVIGRLERHPVPRISAGN